MVGLRVKTGAATNFAKPCFKLVAELGRAGVRVAESLVTKRFLAEFAQEMGGIFAISSELSVNANL
ncbi:MAG: hypothetical protein ABI680_02905 [Chthoniobacteraceae bacterium]